MIRYRPSLVCSVKYLKLSEKYGGKSVAKLERLLIGMWELVINIWKLKFTLTALIWKAESFDLRTDNKNTRVLNSKLQINSYKCVMTFT